MNITNQDYHLDSSRISNSGLKEFSKSPKHYWAKYVDPNRTPDVKTPALILGSACHTAVFEPNKFIHEFAVAPKIDRRSNAGKAAWEKFEHDNAAKTILTTDQYETAMRVKEAVRNHETARLFLERGRAEQTFYFTDPDSGAPCKIRPDFLSETANYIVDLKTTEDASAEAFGRSAYAYWYHTQAAFYMDGMYLNNVHPEGFLFIAVEKQAPFEVALYFADDETLLLGRQTYLPLLQRYQECREKGLWPGYGQDVKNLKLPNWALSKLKI
jgi:hypothetical protein